MSTQEPPRAMLSILETPVVPSYPSASLNLPQGNLPFLFDGRKTSPGCRLSAPSVLDLPGPGDAGKAKGPLPSLLQSICNSSEGTGAPPDFSLPHALLGALLPEAIQGAHRPTSKLAMFPTLLWRRQLSPLLQEKCTSSHETLEGPWGPEP